MDAFRSYITSLRQLAAREASEASDLELRRRAALDGEASARLRQLVPIARRQAIGAFFSPSALAQKAVGPVLATIGPTSIVIDPACGAGDLLIPALERMLALTAKDDWLAHRLVGHDLQPLFVEATRLRLSIAAQLHGRRETEGSFDRITVQDGMSSTDISTASHVLVNPPFTRTLLEGADWASGRVNSAATFLINCMERAAGGARIVAILPDVLRTGSNYAKWRNRVEALAVIADPVICGRFDPWTDVDVFSLSLRRRQRRITSPRRPNWTVDAPGHRVGDYFRVSVGTVVNNRDPMSGPEVPYLTARTAPIGSTLGSIDSTRSFAGRLVSPPFVVVRRTSSPSDRLRACATLVSSGAPVAVDNHLLVIKPLLDGAEDLDELMQVLARAETTSWLNRRIRCRHLTVTSVADIPWNLER